MERQGKERGILKLEPRPRVTIETTTRTELTPQGSWERPPVSPQPSVDRLSVTWAEPSSMTSSGVNLFHLPSETPVNNEVKFSPSAGDGSEDEDYSASLSAVLRQRRASVRRSRKGRVRRPSSPFLPDEPRTRRRSSAYTSSSGDTAISMEEGQPTTVVTQEQIFENIHLHKEVLGSVKQQPLGMRRKLKIVHQAKGYIKRHEGQLQERLAQSKSTRDIYARFNILIAAKWQQLKREAANTSNLLIPWELRIKEIESHFGSVVASYFTFLRWLFWVNLVIGFILMVFVIVPEYLTANAQQDGERKIIMEEERRNASNLLTLWEFEGVLKCSPIFYGYYTNVDRPEYRMPLAYFLTGLVVYIYSFVATLRKMAENSRMSKLSEKEDECIFSWKLFTGWDFMIGNAETAHNRIASVILGFKEALLEEAEKKKDLRNWRIISLRALVNICVVILLAVSAFAVVTVVSRSDDGVPKARSWWRENETTIVVTGISITFPVFFELLGFLEHYHPRKQLRLQLARIMLLNLLNLYSLILALFSKIEGMSIELYNLKPILNVNASIMPESVLTMNELLAMNVPTTCSEIRVPCPPHNIVFTLPSLSINEMSFKSMISPTFYTTQTFVPDVKTNPYESVQKKTNTLIVKEVEHFVSKATAEQTIKNGVTLNKYQLLAENLLAQTNDIDIATATFIETTTASPMSNEEMLKLLRELDAPFGFSDESNETSGEDYTFDQLTTESESTDLITNSFEVSNNPTITREYTDTSSFNVNTSVTTVSNYENTDITEQYTTDNSSIENSSLKTENIMTFSSNQYISTSSSSPEFGTHQTTDNNVTIELTTNPYTIEEHHRVSQTLAPTSTEVIQDLSSEWTTINYIITDNNFSTDFRSTKSSIDNTHEMFCPNISFNCTVYCGGNNITQVIIITNCTIIEKVCYMKKCVIQEMHKEAIRRSQPNGTLTDVAYVDDHNRTMYNLTTATKKKLLKLCWETMFGQELVKLTMMDLVFVLLGTLFMDFFRALFVRYMNRCWCWDLEKKFPEYGDFKIAENILHLINNQGMVWMGMFFSPGLVVLNVFKLVIMMYLRSWAVMTCNVPHEVVFRVSKSNNFYLALLLTMLFLCVLPVGYSIVWVQPSWHCGPFSEYEKIYHILTNNIYKLLPQSLNFALECIASPAIVIPLLVLLVLIIYYLTSLTNSLREANNDLKVQLRRERTEERRKMFQLADTRRRVGSSAMDNTPFARWKKALPTLPLSKSIDSDDRKTTSENEQQKNKKVIKKKGGIFAKIVNMALDRKTDVDTVSEIENDRTPNLDDETDTEFHETLPKEVLKIKDIIITTNEDLIKKPSIDVKTIFKIKDEFHERHKHKLSVQDNVDEERTDKKAVLESQHRALAEECELAKTKAMQKQEKSQSIESENIKSKMCRKQASESSTQSKQSDSIGSVIPVITISATESDEEILQAKTRKDRNNEKMKNFSENSEEASVDKTAIIKKSSPEAKSLRRQSSVESISDQKSQKKDKPEEGHKYQYSL